MRFYRRLRWRLIIAPLLVALLGTLSMIALTALIVDQFAPDLLNRELAFLIQNPTQIETTQQNLLQSFQRALNRSVAIAALIALGGGTLYSYVLWRSLVVPLRDVAATSRRIASGRYSERVKMPRQNLGMALTQLITSFNQMAQALASVEQQRITLIGNVAHELRTPLAGLRGYLEGVQDGVFEPSVETIGVLQQEVERLTRLVEDLQTMATVEAGAVELTFQPFDLQETARQVVTRFQPQARKKKIDLRMENSPEEAVIVIADPDRTVQILTNLVNNALQYTSAGGVVTVTVADSNAGVIPVASRSVIVSDSGIGIPAAALPYIFERFYRVDESRSRGSGGSGIGLTIARHLAWQMAGDLTAASEGPGAGSTFTLTLPLWQDSP